MANRLIGVEITPRTIRVAVLGQHRGLVTVIALEQRPYPEADEWPGLFETMIPGGLQLSDRVAAALPAGQAYVRTLQFPFKERRKILAAAPFELAAQLPVALEECHTVLLPPGENAAGAKVVATAVPKANLDAFLQPFEQNRVPLQVLDLMPYALAGGAGDAVGTGVLVCINEGEATFAGLVEGQIVVYRHFPLPRQEFDRSTMEQFLQEILLFRNQTSHGRGSLFLTGSLATPEVLDRARELGLAAELLPLTVGHKIIPPAFVPPVAIALRAGKKVADRCFNLRQGAYAYHGEAAVLKKTLLGMGGLLGASLLLFAAATVLNYRDKSQQADVLLQQMTRQYQQTFPGSQLTIEVPLQMQSKVQELRNRATELGIDTPPQPLAILKTLSSLAERHQLEVEELLCNQESCVLTATADTFDTVNRIKEQLGTSTLFTKVEVAESRKGIDGSRIEFRLRLPLATEGGER